MNFSTEAATNPLIDRPSAMRARISVDDTSILRVVTAWNFPEAALHHRLSKEPRALRARGCDRAVSSGRCPKCVHSNQQNELGTRVLFRQGLERINRVR